ncbi:CapA family protein [Luteolibacter sp. LG18]|uniref:CapA family protein n=1 Tax=Luteolibacter sp. LG18 TaxID=2819286 RepID=UPI002B29C689|nr:hypothetical protein llg_10750 [Luteolibacter sp. LG18]
MKALLAGWLACLAVGFGRELPVFIEDNHASAFAAIARTVDLDEPHLLVMVDAHSDASAVDGSNRLREGLRRVSTEAERRLRVDGWRRDGTLQAYNWIEPLMPAPVAKVWWLGGRDGELAEVKRQLDERPGADTRGGGKLGGRYELITEGDLARPAGLPVIATIDLDAFAGMEPQACERRFDAIWSAVLGMKDLRLVTFAISRPWLKDDAEAERLLMLALTRSLAVANARVHFQPFGIEGPDRSERAKEFYGNREVPPRFDPSASTVAMRRFLVGNRGRIEVEDPRWAALLDHWSTEDGEWRIVAENLQPETDGITRAAVEALPVLRVQSSAGSAFRRVEWSALVPELACYNVLPDLPAGKMFASAAPPYVRELARSVAVTEDGALPPRLWQSFLPAGWGRIKLVARVELADGTMAATPPFEVRATTGLGFHAGLSEQFGLPYVFGAGFLRQQGETGPETGVGNDCANFLVYAWRRAGDPLPWCNPAQLRRYLEVIRTGCKPGDAVPFAADMVGRGLVVHLGSHVAAVWEDRPPLGVLTGEDLVAHHLGGFPEVVRLDKLLEKRTGFDLLVRPEFHETGRLGVAGDVNLAAVERGVVLEAAKVFGGKPWIANLEGAVGQPKGARKYEFTWPPERLDWLREAGCVAVSVANNHAADGDAAATRGALRERGIGFTGGGRLEEAARPWQGSGFAVIAVNFIVPGPPEATVETDGSHTLPAHASEVRDAIAVARAAGLAPVVFAHWGREFTAEVSAEQTEWARRFVDWGASAVVGSHPHVAQRADFYRGRPIVYSLGDFIWKTPRNTAPPVWLVVDARGGVKLSGLR